MNEAEGPVAGLGSGTAMVPGAVGLEPAGSEGSSTSHRAGALLAPTALQREVNRTQQKVSPCDSVLDLS